MDMGGVFILIKILPCQYTLTAPTAIWQSRLHADQEIYPHEFQNASACTLCAAFYLIRRKHLCKGCNSFFT